MSRSIYVCGTILVAALVAGCGSSSEIQIPQIVVNNGQTTSVSPQFAGLGGGIPAGVEVTFIDDVVVIRGANFTGAMRVFFGMNTELATRHNSLTTTSRFALPPSPFLYTDPATGAQTRLEVEIPVKFQTESEIIISIPAAVACNAAFTNPIVRLYGAGGSSVPVANLFWIVGPRIIALTPNNGVDLGGYALAVHGDFFSRFTQVGFRYTDPADGLVKTVGLTPDTDIEEEYVDRHTLVVPDWPGIVEDVTHGLAAELPVTVLLHENVDALTGSIANEPFLDGQEACAPLRTDSGVIALQPNGVRNTEKANGFTFLPTGVTDYPRIDGITPESGSEVGGNTVIIHGQQFDAFTADISDPANLGVGIEFPPESGNFIAPQKATLVDRQTLAIVMPASSVDIPEKVDFCLRNKFSIDNPVAGAPGNGTCIVFDDVYTYIPVPPILPPVVKAIHPAFDVLNQPQGKGADYGLERFLVVGEWFDGDTVLNGGFEFLLPDGTVIQTQRTILHNSNLLEIYTKRLPETFYPLAADLVAGVRARNVVGHADFENAMVFTATPDAGATPVLTEIFPAAGPTAGGNQILVVGENFDTTTSVEVGGVPALDIQFVNSGLVIATLPGGAGSQAVRVVDDGDASTTIDYTFDDAAAQQCAVLGVLSPDTGSSTGGYPILAYGVNLTPVTRVEFGAVLPADGSGDGNFSPDVFFVSDNLLRVVVPEAFPAQIGAEVQVGATDPLNGCNDVLRLVPFTFTAAQMAAPEILFVDSTVQVPLTQTDLAPLRVVGSDRILVIGRNFDQGTTFDIEKPQSSTQDALCTGIEVLTPNLAVMFTPASPDGAAGVADLQAHNAFGDSSEFTVEYVEPGPPSIIDVRNLDDGSQSTPIDARDRLVIFGDNFVDPVTVRLTGCDLADSSTTITVTLAGTDVTRVEDHILGVNVPSDTFCEGPLAIEVETIFGTTSFDDANGDPIFVLVGPQPPLAEGMFPATLNSNGGDEVVLFGRYFTETTEFSVRTNDVAPGVFIPVLDARIISETVALLTMPMLPGGLPPAGVAGQVRSEETNAALAQKIAGDPFTVSGDLFSVVNDLAPTLLAVHPDHGSIDGGEQVLLVGAGFLKATGAVNVNAVRIVDPVLGDLGVYSEASAASLPLDSLDPASKGMYVVLSDNEILLVTHQRPALFAPAISAAASVIVESDLGDTSLAGGFTYQNTLAVRTPLLLSITPNEAMITGGSSHLLAGGFLSGVEEIVFTRASDGTAFAIPIDGGSFDGVNDSFLVFDLPDLMAAFLPGDQLDIHVRKTVDGNTLVSNTLPDALTLTLQQPPVLDPVLAPVTSGSGFGGTLVTITGDFFTRQTQVLFGTIPARIVSVESATELLVISPSLPANAPGTALDLSNLHVTDGKVDVAVFTQGGWAVLEDAYTYTPEAPTVTAIATTTVAEGATARVTVDGSGFVPGNTDLVASEGGVTIVSQMLDRIVFDYTAPTRPAGTAGPLTPEVTLSTNMGVAANTIGFEVILAPTLDGVTTDYGPNSAAATTSGVHESQFIVATATGANLGAGGSLAVHPRVGDPIFLTEIGAGDSFSGPGQFRSVAPGTIEFTPPFVHSNQVPNRVDGNPNVGPTQLSYENRFGVATMLDPSFVYVPHATDFEQFAFSLPDSAVPTSIAIGDINADGVQDAAQLGGSPSNAWMILADTFGPGIDVNGDGVSPDFAGTFTITPIDNAGLETFRVRIDTDTLSKSIHLAQLDGDPQLEILVPGQNETGVNRARVMIVDIDSTGIVSQSLFTPGVSRSDEINSLAVGDFDGDARDDFAYITDADDADDRRIGVVTSPGSAFTFVETREPLPAAADDFTVGKLGVGDWDGNGTDDLAYGAFRAFGMGFSGSLADSPIWFVEVDPSGPTIVSQLPLMNLKGGPVLEIHTTNLDGDDKEDAIVLVETRAYSSDFGGTRDSGYAIVLDPLGLEMDEYVTTGLPNRYGAMGDVNGDQIPDLVLGHPKGEFIIHLGDGNGGFVDAGRSWTPLSVPSPSSNEKGGFAAGDINRDGLDEILQSDVGIEPHNVILWNNVSR